MLSVCRFVRQTAAVAIKTLSRPNSASRFFARLRFQNKEYAMKHQSLLKVDEQKQKALRELAKIYQHLQVSQQRLVRVHRFHQISLETEMSLREALDRASYEIHKMSCQLLGISWQQKD